MIMHSGAQVPLNHRFQRLLKLTSICLKRGSDASKARVKDTQRQLA